MQGHISCGAITSDPQSMANQAASFDHAAHAARRLAIDGSPTLKLHLQDWTEDKKQELISIEYYRTRCNTAKTELYQLMGFYSVFQGVVFTGVATASKLSCQTAWGPAALSLLTSIATAISVHFKSSNYASEGIKLLNAVHEIDKMNARIDKLQREGSGFDFGELEAINRRNLGHEKVRDEKKSQARFYCAIMSFLFFFSILVLGCCFFILCWEDKEKFFLKNKPPAEFAPTKT